MEEDQRGVTLEKFIHKSLMENQWYRDIYERAKTVKKWFDAGRHFYCEEFLGHEMLMNPKETKKHTIIQFFLGHHGKTDVDGALFGHVGHSVKELKKNTRLETSEQLKDICEEAKTRHQANKSAEEKELNRWIFLLWKPGAYPKKMVRMKQKNMQSHHCWEVKPMGGYGGLLPFKIYSHGLVEDKKTRMLLRPGQEFKREQGPPADARVDWTRAAVCTQVTPETDIGPIEKKREGVAKQMVATSLIEAE